MSEGAATARELSVVYDAADLRSLWRACSKCRRSIWWIAAVPLIGIVVEFADGARGRDLLIYSLPYLLISVLMVVGIVWIAPPLQIRSRRKNGWGEPMTVRLTEHDIVTRHPSQDSQFHWAAIKDVVANHERLFLFTTANCAIILPRRIFDDGAHFDDWVKRARDYWHRATVDRAE